MNTKKAYQFSTTTNKIIDIIQKKHEGKMILFEIHTVKVDNLFGQARSNIERLNKNWEQEMQPYERSLGDRTVEEKNSLIIKYAKENQLLTQELEAYAKQFMANDDLQMLALINYCFQNLETKSPLSILCLINKKIDIYLDACLLHAAYSADIGDLDRAKLCLNAILNGEKQVEPYCREARALQFRVLLLAIQKKLEEFEVEIDTQPMSIRQACRNLENKEENKKQLLAEDTNLKKLCELQMLEPKDDDDYHILSAYCKGMALKYRGENALALKYLQMVPERYTIVGYKQSLADVIKEINLQEILKDKDVICSKSEILSQTIELVKKTINCKLDLESIHWSEVTDLREQGWYKNVEGKGLKRRDIDVDEVLDQIVKYAKEVIKDEKQILSLVRVMCNWEPCSQKSSPTFVHAEAVVDLLKNMKSSYYRAALLIYQAVLCNKGDGHLFYLSTVSKGQDDYHAQSAIIKGMAYEAKNDYIEAIRAYKEIGPEDSVAYQQRALKNIALKQSLANQQAEDSSCVIF